MSLRYLYLAIVKALTEQGSSGTQVAVLAQICDPPSTSLWPGQLPEHWREVQETAPGKQ